MPGFDYDLFVIGGGSGGVRAGRLAAGLGKRVGIAEESRYGGTCVVRGCVPKKLYVYASQFPEHFEDAAGYGWTVGDTRFEWHKLVAAKEKEISRLEAVYRQGLLRAGADVFNSRAEIVDAHTVLLKSTGKTVTADQILIATGGRPNPHVALPGHELCIVSDDAFDLETLPGNILIAGGGYIAVEFANIFHGLGVETTLVYRGREILSRFDPDIRRHLHETMEAKGIRIILGEVFENIEKNGEGRLRAHTSGGRELITDQVMLALGRSPNTNGLGLESAGVELDALGAVKVDGYSRTNVENIWAIGDVTNRIQLTPVAIHEGMCFVETAFRDNPTPVDHDCIATAVFSQPEIGTVGFSEDLASKNFEELEVFVARFRPMRHALSGRREKMLMKLIVDAQSRVVIGAHVMGPDAGEMGQLLAIPIKARLTKDAFDRTMAVHPTAAEELVTMYEPSYRIIRGERTN
jgi:glutathione reductase (NADPH)